MDWTWQTPASGAERWGSEGMAAVAFFIFLTAAACSLAVGFVFWRDYSDASPMTRGYFYALLWKRAAAFILFSAYLIMDWHPNLGVVMVVVAGLLYDAVSISFLAFFSKKGDRIKRAERVGEIVRTEVREYGLDFDTMDTSETISYVKKGLASLADKTAAENSNVHA